MADETTAGLSPAQTANGLRAFLIQSIFQGPYGRAFGFNGPVFTGYVFLLGGAESDIAFLTSSAALASILQLLCVRYTSRIRKRKRFIILCGIIEVTLRASPILIPLVIGVAYQIKAIYVLGVVGLSFTYLRAPLMNDWLASTTPTAQRATFLSQRWLGQTLTLILAGFAFGAILDMYPKEESYPGFAIVFGLGLICGLGIFIALTAAPMNDEPVLPPADPAGTFSEVLKDREFLKLLMFRTSVQFGVAIALPFYSVFMLKKLGLSYTTIALYNNIALVVMLFSNRPAGAHALEANQYFRSLYWVASSDLCYGY